MPSPDTLKIKCYTPIPSVPEIDLDGKMLTKDAKTKDCLFTMTEYLSSNVLQSIPKDYRIRQFFDKGLFKSFRKQNPFNNTEKTETSKEGATKKPDGAKVPVKKSSSTKEGSTKKPEAVKEDSTKKPEEPAQEDSTKKPEEPAQEGSTKKPEEPGKEDSTQEGSTKKPEEPRKEDSTKNPDIQVGGKESLSPEKEKENIANKRELISTYRKIINHNIRLTLNTLFQKNNKIVIKGNTYTIGYYNWTDYDWDIDAKRLTFDKKQYVTSQSVKQDLEKIPSILKHGLTSTKDALKAENDFFSVTVFDNEEEAMKAKEREAAMKAKEKEAAIKAKENEAAIKAKEEEAAIKAKEEEAAIKAKEEEDAIKAKEKLQQKPEVMDLSKDDNEAKVEKPKLNTVMNKINKTNDNSNPYVTELGSLDSSNELSYKRRSLPSSTNYTESVKPESESERGSGTVNEVPITQSGGEASENTQENSFRDSRRSSDPRYRSSYFDRRFPYDPRYDPRYRSHSKMVNVDESNFAIYISVELYLVKGENLTPEDEHNLNCKSNWNNVLEKFDKLTGRKKRGILPDYTLEPTSKSESAKPNGTSSSTIKEPEPISKEPTTKEPTSKEPTSKEPTTKEPEPTTKEPDAHGGRIRVKRKTLRRKKRKTIKKKRPHKRKGFRTTRKRKLRGSRRK